MRYVLWGVQILLTLVILASGALKLSQPYDALATQMAWVGAVPPWLVLAIGLAEVLGSAGLILPSASGVLPWLTPLAAAGLALTMLLATLFQLARGALTMASAPVPLLLGPLAAPGADARRSPASTAARGAASAGA